MNWFNFIVLGYILALLTLIGYQQGKYETLRANYESICNNRVLDYPEEADVHLPSEIVEIIPLINKGE
jgi:hypothetical protein